MITYSFASFCCVLFVVALILVIVFWSEMEESLGKKMRANIAIGVGFFGVFAAGMWAQAEANTNEKTALENANANLFGTGSFPRSPIRFRALE